VVTFPIDLRVGVLEETAQLMASRLREAKAWQTGDGGGMKTMFTDGTRPTLYAAQIVCAREAGKVLTDFPLAKVKSDYDALTTIGALRSAIQLEGSWYGDQVSSQRSPAELWLKLLDHELNYANRMVPGEGDSDGDGRGGMAPKWRFAPYRLQHVEGAELERLSFYWPAVGWPGC
jgi:hypothetical protein